MVEGSKPVPDRALELAGRQLVRRSSGLGCSMAAEATGRCQPDGCAPSQAAEAGRGEAGKGAQHLEVRQQDLTERPKPAGSKPPVQRGPRRAPHEASALPLLGGPAIVAAFVYLLAAMAALPKRDRARC